MRRCRPLAAAGASTARACTFTPFISPWTSDDRRAGRVTGEGARSPAMGISPWGLHPFGRDAPANAHCLRPRPPDELVRGIDHGGIGLIQRRRGRPGRRRKKPFRRFLLGKEIHGLLDLVLEHGDRHLRLLPRRGFACRSGRLPVLSHPITPLFAEPPGGDSLRARTPAPGDRRNARSQRGSFKRPIAREVRAGTAGLSRNSDHRRWSLVFLELSSFPPGAGDPEPVPPVGGGPPGHRHADRAAPRGTPEVRGGGAPDLMWNYLYELWRSVLRRAPREKEPPAAPEDPSGRDALREELRRLLEERSTLLNTASSYREFGYDDLAERVQEQVAAVDHRIAALRLQLRR